MTDRQLRLTLVGPYPPPFGGIASHFVNVIPELLARGVADIAVVSFGAVHAVEQQQGATVYRVTAAEQLGKTAARPAASLAAMRVLGSWKLGARRLAAEAVRTATVDEVVERHRSNVVSFYQANESLSLLPLASRWGTRIGRVLTVFGEVYDAPEFFEARREQVGQLLDAVHARLSSSQHCARSFRRLGLTQPIEAVYYGIDLERFRAGDAQRFRTRHRIAFDDVVVTYMGRFTAEMGVDSVLGAAPAWLDAHPSIRIVLAGARGPLLDHAESLRERTAGRIVVITDMPFSEQPDLYAASDIVLAPTRDQHACMGMSIKEAMAAGRAVIGTEAGGIPEAIVHEETGLLVPLGENLLADTKALEEAVLRLVADASLRRAFGDAGRRRAERVFSNETTVTRILEVFRSVQPQ
jgi:glycosyltransferase involved in cell wall biosynthesis